MERLTPYIKMIKKYSLLYLLMASIAIGANLIGLVESIVSNRYNIVDGEIMFLSGNQMGVGIVIFIYGIFLTSNYFNIAMNIRGDRQSYIKTIFLSMIIISLLFSLVSNTTDLLYKYILESTSGYNVNIVNNGVRTIDIVDIINSLYSYFNISVRELNINMDTIKLGYLGNVINLTLRLIMNCSIGFLIGALSYRIKKIISTIICIGVPVVGVIWIIREFVTNNSIFVEKLVNRFLIPMAEFFASYNNVFLLESLTTSICIMGTILLLRKAPIKEYANDLI